MCDADRSGEPCDAAWSDYSDRGGLVRKFTHYSDIALNQAVVVPRNGKPRKALISVQEHERLT
jgi:hypothetical protein